MYICPATKKEEILRERYVRCCDSGGGEGMESWTQLLFKFQYQLCLIGKNYRIGLFSENLARVV
jgi:hypothetical protein